jgi:2,4-diaminopentanoate dehydrogenase
MNKVQRIWGRSTYNADDFGVALAEHHGVGLTMAQFESDIAAADKMSDHERTKIIEIGNFNPVPSWNANGWLCARFGLSVTRQVQLCTPIVHDRPLYSKTLGHEIKVGNAIGMSARAITETAQGIILETEAIGKIYSPDEADTNEWELHGEHKIRVEIVQPMTKEITCSVVINRIPDVISAPPGFVTTNNFDPPSFSHANFFAD